MKRLMVLLMLLVIFTTACSKNTKIAYDDTAKVELESQLVDDIHSEKPNNKIEYTYKYEYLKKLDDLDEDVKKSKSLLEEESNLKMIEIEESKFEIWNNELNNIYKVIKEQLSEKKYEIFKNQEISWLDERDKKAEDNANKFEGMDFAQVEYNLSLAKLTKERCYKLVNEYLQ